MYIHDLCHLKKNIAAWRSTHVFQVELVKKVWDVEVTSFAVLPNGPTVGVKRTPLLLCCLCCSFRPLSQATVRHSSAGEERGEKHEG